MSGVIDRLHLLRNEHGVIDRVEIIDFKTDKIDDLISLGLRYQEQMNAYRSAISKIYPEAQVSCVVISVHHGSFVIIEP